MIKIRDVPNLTLGKADSGLRSNVAIGIEASATSDFELAVSRVNQEPKFQLVLNNEGPTGTGSNYGGIAFTQGVSAQTVMASIKTVYGTDGYPDLSFNTRSVSNALVIKADGKVGIGTESPITREGASAPWLTLKSNSGGIAFTEADSTDPNTAYIHVNGQTMMFGYMDEDGTNPSTHLTIASDGDVMIEENLGIGTGTTVSGAKLVVNGNSDNGDSDCRINIIDNDSTTGSSVPAISFRSGASTQIYQIRANDSLGLTFRNSSDVTKIVFNDNGNVGIGTGSSGPFEKLQVENGNIYIRGDTAGQGLLIQDSTGSTGTYSITRETIDSGNGYLKFGTPSNETHSFVFDGGKVGIGTGTNALTYDLTVQSSASADMLIGSTSGSRALLILDGSGNGDGIGGDYAWIAHEPDGRLNIENSHTGNVITLGGKVGIGTGSGSLTERLEVIGSVKLSESLELASGKMIDWGNGDARIIEGETQDYSLTFKTWDGTGCDPRMKILGNGNVGIGTGASAPTEKLEVNGTVKATLFKGEFQGGGGSGGGIGIFNAQSNIENDNLECFSNGNTEQDGGTVVFEQSNNTSSPYSKIAKVNSLYEKRAVNYIPVQPGAVLEGEIWYRVESGDAGTPGTVFFGVSRYDKDKKYISSNSGLAYFSSATQLEDSQWHKVSGTISLPTSHTAYSGSDGGPVRYIRPYVIINYSSGTNTVRFGGMYIARQKAISVGGDQTLGSEVAGQIIKETNLFTRTDDHLFFDALLSEHLHEFQNSTNECNCWTLKDIDPLINSQGVGGLNIAAESNNHDVINIGSENQTPVLKINKQGLIVGFGVRNTIGTGQPGGVSSAKLVTNGELYTNSAMNSRSLDNITPTNGKITLQLWLKDSAFSAASHNHNTVYGGSLYANANTANTNGTIGLMAADGNTILGGAITVPYATRAGTTLTSEGASNADVADTLKTVKTATNAYHYLTFVNTNNNTPTGESLYTMASIKVNPSKGTLAFNPDTMATDQGLAYLLGMAVATDSSGSNASAPAKRITTAKVKTWLGLKSAAYETKGTFALATNVKTPVPANALFTDTNTWRGIHDTANDGSTTVSISSNWAFDHAASSKGHPRDTRSQVAATYNTVIGTDTDIDCSASEHIDKITVTDGVITAMSKQTMSLGDLGFTGATNANYITSNSDILNGRGFTTYTSDQALNTTSSSEFYKLNTTQISTTDPSVKCFYLYPTNTATNAANANDTGKLWKSWLHGDKGPHGEAWGDPNEGPEMGGNFAVVLGSKIGDMQAVFEYSYINFMYALGFGGVLSDQRVKTNVKNLSLGLDFVRMLRPVEYERVDSKTPRIKCGFISQEVEKALEDIGAENPSFISSPKHGEEENPLQFVDYTQFHAVLINAVKELDAKVQELEAKLEEK